MEQATEYQTPHGNPVTLLTRDDTADRVLIEGLLRGDEYGLKSLTAVEGTALDIGAHIGAISLALLTDHPGLRVIAVEPIHENADMIRRAGQSFIQQGRLIVHEAAAASRADEGAIAEIGYDYTHHDGTEASYVNQNRYIGGMWREGWEGAVALVRCISLRELVEQYGPFILTKIDAEGAEYPFFADGAEGAGVIVGEWHDGGPERLEALLAPTHEMAVKEDHGGTGIFWAMPRVVAVEQS